MRFKTMAGRANSGFGAVGITQARGNGKITGRSEAVKDLNKKEVRGFRRAIDGKEVAV